MKLTAGLVASLAGVAAAAQPVAEVYLVPARETSTTRPLVSPGVARLVLLQRLASSGRGPSLGDELPQGVGVEEAVSVLNRFGKAPPPLFADRGNDEPRQLVVMLEGMTETQIKDLGREFKMEPAFAITNPPSASGHDELVKTDLHNRGVLNGDSCDMHEIVNPLDDCWNGRHSAVAKYDVAKDPEVLSKVSHKLAQLSELAGVGELETMIVLLPSTAGPKSWSDQPQELRRRRVEEVMSSVGRPVPTAAPNSSAGEKVVLYSPTEPIPSCFASEAECVRVTNNCSAHGSCLDRWAQRGGPGGEACFACHCLSTRSESGSLTHWAGLTCAKQDISVSFWLLAGVTLGLVGILSLAISMLFNVGEEKLPGVIGAGVSRSK